MYTHYKDTFGDDHIKCSRQRPKRSVLAKFVAKAETIRHTYWRGRRSRRAKVRPGPGGLGYRLAAPFRTYVSSGRLRLRMSSAAARRLKWA
jgi:hypothetical protein